MKKEVMLNNMMVGNGVVEKGGNKMLKENEAVRCHCLHCNAMLNKKGRKYCDRNCYNASRKSDTKNKPVKVPVETHEITSLENKVQTPVKTPETVDTQNRSVVFEKALLNMQKFGSALTLHRLKKLLAIAGERAHVIRVGGGIVIYWFINDEGYIIYYAPGKLVTYKKSNLKDMRASINKLATHKTYKDGMSITEYIELAEQMKGGE